MKMIILNNDNMKRLILTAAIGLMLIDVSARESVGTGKSVAPSNTPRKLMKFGVDCQPATASADLDINNVRTKILNGGDMWWDLSNPKYEIPKINDLNAVRKNSLFAGAIWIGGFEQGSLKIAAMTYRQGGSDFWPGPLDTKTANTNSENCKAYDKIFQLTREEIIAHAEAANSGSLPKITDNIRNWPGNGVGLDAPEYLAPYVNKGGSPLYEPEQGDYPVLQNECKGMPISDDDNLPDDQPDKMLWFVYNDNGNVHTETNGLPIGLELQTTAFAYATNNEINNMTFYKTRIINRGSTSLEETYFGEWVDADLGNYSDDYVGCDVGLSLGFTYNGDDNDEGVLGYGLNPPSVGVDFFESPRKDTIMNGDTTTFELGMSKFVYYNNDFTLKGNPTQAIHYYNYLRGRWTNGDPIKWGGDGFSGSQPANYMFPGTTDPAHPNDNWTERQAGNTPADRRFLQTSGPFTLKPGAINYVTIGVVWARTSAGGAEGSLSQLKAASRKAQELFDNCFDILDGPDAPKVEVVELDQELVFNFKETRNSELYSEATYVDGKLKYYRFQGYRIYQLKDGTVGTGDLEDVSLAREIFISDLKDSITQLVNSPFDGTLGQPLPKLMVSSTNEGLVHTLSVKEDAFATGSNKNVVNFKNYYFLVLSYAGLPGHPAEEYLAGRRIRQFSASPHKPIGNSEGGYTLKTKYGDGPQIIRMEGTGNGGMPLELDDASVNDILKNNFNTFLAHPKYKRGSGPLDIKVIDPIKVPKGDFELTLLEKPIPTSPRLRDIGLIDSNTTWILVKLPGDTIFADTTINYSNQQILIESKGGKKIGDWGLAISIGQVKAPSRDVNDKSNGFISWEVLWEDNSKQWLTATPDLDNQPIYDWIRSGGQGSNLPTKDYSINDYFLGSDPLDRFEVYEKIWNGRVAPYRLASRNVYNTQTPPQQPAQMVQGPAFGGDAVGSVMPMTNPYLTLENLSSIDLVFTDDKSKWTQCIVLEMGEDEGNNFPIGTKKFHLRKQASLDINGNEVVGEQGRSWFPGYAINLETGERLNIIISEDSYQGSENGKDMKWNPTDRGNYPDDFGNNYSVGYPSLGGRHYIYVMGSYDGYLSAINPNKAYSKGPTYDGGLGYLQIYMSMETMSDKQKSDAIYQRVMSQCMWVMPAMLADGFKMKEVGGMPVPPTEVSVKLRVKKPYRYFNTIADSKNSDNPKYSFNTNNIYTEVTKKAGEKLLDIVNIVPNPYYAYSKDYETNPIQNFVKFTNLPVKCEISIYTLDGQLARRMYKDDVSTELLWDLKNQAKVPIASGMYIIHVNAFELGEKVLKWMGVMRELDLDSF
jgi:hypothetical protein